MVKKWAKIAKALRIRSRKQVRDRYLNCLNPSIQRRKWTDEEDVLLKELMKELGHKWSQLVVFMPGRTENQIKNRFYALLRKDQVKDIADPEPKAEFFEPFSAIKTEGFETIDRFVCEKYNIKTKIETMERDISTEESISILKQEFDHTPFTLKLDPDFDNGLASKVKSESNSNSVEVREKKSMASDLYHWLPNLIVTNHNDQFTNSNTKQAVLSEFSIKLDNDRSDAYKKVKYETSDKGLIFYMKEEVL